MDRGPSGGGSRVSAGSDGGVNRAPENSSGSGRAKTAGRASRSAGSSKARRPHAAQPVGERFGARRRRRGRRSRRRRPSRRRRRSPSATTGQPQAWASTGTIPKSSTPGQERGRRPAVELADVLVRSPAQKRHVRIRPWPGAGASSGPVPTMVSGAPSRRQASMATSSRLYGTSADTTRKPERVGRRSSSGR